MDNLAIDGMIVDDDTQGIEVETTAGFSDDAPIGLITRQGRTITPQITLSQHNLSNSVNLPSGNTEDDLPIWHRVITRIDPSEIGYVAIFPVGFSQRLRGTCRAVPREECKFGDTSWFNLPKVSLYGNLTTSKTCN
jgi:hypothetical protein